MKPRIWFSKGEYCREWFCSVINNNPNEPAGYGQTPQEAYADWKRKTDSLSRIDADHTQA